MIVWLTPMAVLLAAVAPTGRDAPPLDPAAAIRLADTGHVSGTEASVALPVVSAARARDAVFLNSAANFRSPENFSYRVTLAAAKKLEKRFGAPLERTLIGKTVTAYGIVRGMPMYTVVAGRAHSFARAAYSLNIDLASQVTEVR